MGGRWRRSIAGAAVAIGLVAGMAGFGADRAAAAAAEKRTWVQGDSVMVGAAPVVRTALDTSGWQHSVNGWVGLGTRKAIDIFRDRQAELGSVVVVQLGLNDWGLGSAGYGRLIDEAMGVLAGRHVIWLTAPRFRPEVDNVNTAIRAAASRHRDLEVLEWGPLSDAHPEATYSDRIHLRPAGQQLMASAVRDALDRWWSHRCAVPTGDTETHNAVARLYRAYFRRDADDGGMNYWVPKYRSGELCLTDISEFFAASTEFTATYGSLDIPDFVRRVYLNVLDREPDADGYTYWAQRLTYGGMRRGEMMVGFSESPEFRAKTGLTA